MWWITSNVLSSHFHNAWKHIKILFRENFRIKCANKKVEVKQNCQFPATLWLFPKFSNTWGKEAYFQKILKIKIWKQYLLHAFSFKIPILLYFPTPNTSHLPWSILCQPETNEIRCWKPWNDKEESNLAEDQKIPLQVLKIVLVLFLLLLFCFTSQGFSV